MDGEVGALEEALPALPAAVGALARVQPPVFAEGGALREAPPAFSAGIGPVGFRRGGRGRRGGGQAPAARHATARPPVALQVAAPAEAPPAVSALVGLFRRVALLVPFQVA